MAVVDHFGGEERELATGGPGQFVAELNMFTGERLYTTAVVCRPGSVLVVRPATVSDLIGTVPELGDTIMPTLFARRRWLVAHRSGFEIIGSRFSPDTGRLREFATRNRLAYAWLDLDNDEAAQRLLAKNGLARSDVPVVCLGGGDVLLRPSNVDLAGAVGLVTSADAGAVYDLVVVGAGPSGLAACVYASSEGLSVAAIDAVGPGGQIGTTARFENYLGFPVGISGDEFAERAVLQAKRFGTTIVVARRTTALGSHNGLHSVGLDGAGDVLARSVIIATGMEYRRLDVPGIDQFENTSVFYSPLDSANRVLPGAPAVVVGGANSAGQAATALAAAGHSVTLVVRDGDLSSTMVRYLINRVDSQPKIEVLLNSQVMELVGQASLESVVVEDDRSGTRRLVPATALFVLIGSTPYSGWLAGAVRLDESGYVLTGAAVGPDARHSEPWLTLGRDPMPLETSRPGVFAAGDVRAGSLKRVGSAVGDGSIAARLVHEWLAGVQPPIPDGNIALEEAKK